MRALLLAVFLLPGPARAVVPISSISSLKSDSDVAGVNNNFLQISQALTSLQNAMNSCPGSGQAVTGLALTGSEWSGASCVTPTTATGDTGISSTVVNGIPSVSQSGQATFGPCLSGSTLTITTGTNPILVSFNGQVNQTGLVQNCQSTILVDGKFIFGGTNNDSGFGGGLPVGVGWNYPIGFTLETAAQTAASHSVCVALRESAGTCASGNKWILAIKEVK